MERSETGKRDREKEEREVETRSWGTEFRKRRQLEFVKKKSVKMASKRARRVQLQAQVRKTVLRAVKVSCLLY